MTERQIFGKNVCPLYLGSQKNGIVPSLLLIVVMGGTLSSAIASRIFTPPVHNHDWDETLNVLTDGVAQTLRQTPTGFQYLHCEPRVTNAKHDPLKTIVVCHGAGTNIERKAHWARDICQQLTTRVVMVEYPGYGTTNPPVDEYSLDGSQKPTEEGCCEALRNVISTIKATTSIKDENIHLIGHSLGTGVVVRYASEMPASRNPLILISPYKSIGRVATDSPLAGWLGLEMFCTIDHLPSIMGPVKIFHGDADDLILPLHALYIHDHLVDGSLPITWIQGANHATTLRNISIVDLAAALEPSGANQLAPNVEL